MAHRPSGNPYSRRPSDDDRRVPDTYDRRRSGFGRSDSYHRDRDRERDRDRDRDRDRGDRDRDRDADQRRDVPSSPRDKDSARDRAPFPDAPRGPKAILVNSASSDVGRVRQDRHGSAGSSPMSPALGGNINSSNAEEAIARVFTRWVEDITEVSRLQIRRENLDRAVKLREVETAQAAQNLNFPSVSELHNKFLKRDKHKLEEVEEKLKAYQLRANKTAKEMGQLLLTALPLVEMKKSVKDADAVCQKGELDILREEFREMKSQFANFQKTSAQEHAALEEQVKALQTQLTQSKDENKTLQGTVKTTEAELDKLRAAFIAEITGLQKQIEDIKALQGDQSNADEIARLALSNTQLLAKNNELEKQIGVLQTEKNQLQSRVSDLEMGFTSQGESVKTLQQESSTMVTKLEDIRMELVGEIQAVLDSTTDPNSLQEKLAQQDTKLEQQDRKLVAVQEKLMELDFTALDEISQNWTFEWPDIKKAVGDIQEQLVQRRHLSQQPEALVSPVPTTAEPEGNAQPDTTSAASGEAVSRQVKEEILSEVNRAVAAKIKSFVDMVIGMVEKMEETAKSTRREVDEISTRLTTIEEQEPDTRLVALESSVGRIDGLEGRIDQMVALESSSEQVKALEGKIAQTETTLEALKTDLVEKTDSLEFQVSSLVTQYNNLSTKDLAERIIGHLDQLSPSPHQLATDMTALDTKVQDIQKQLQEIGTGPVFKETFTKEYDRIDETGKGWQGQTLKRRRLDSNTNGVLQQPVTNTGG